MIFQLIIEFEVAGNRFTPSLTPVSTRMAGGQRGSASWRAAGALGAMSFARVGSSGV